MVAESPAPEGEKRRGGCCAVGDPERGAGALAGWRGRHASLQRRWKRL